MFHLNEITSYLLKYNILVYNEIKKLEEMK